VDRFGGDDVVVCSGRPFEYFSVEEIANNDNDETVKLVWTPELLVQGHNMDLLREFLTQTFPKDFPYGIHVTSWWRSQLFNRKFGGATNSNHLIGGATDTDSVPQRLFEEAIKAWRAITLATGCVGGIELYDWGMHFDSFSDRYGYSTLRVKDNR
jgi:hypothetical protein